MNEKTSAGLPAVDSELLELGVALGQNYAFGLVAGRCSAAQAEALRRLRDQKIYKRCTEKWEDFCRDYLKISRPEADRTIKLLQDFGPAYFEVSQLTRVSSDTFRSIAPAIQDGALHHNGEVIELNVENARRVAAAVDAIRRSLRPLPPSLSAVEKEISVLAQYKDCTERVVRLGKCCNAILAVFEEIAADPDIITARMLFDAVLKGVCSDLNRLAAKHGLS